MANKRPRHRRGTTGDEYRRAQRQIFKGTVCARCGNSKGPIMRVQGCDHPTHADLPYCPTHPLAPSLGHKKDLQHGGRALDPRNHQLEHFGCNSSAGAKSRAKGRGRSASASEESWDW